MMLVLVIALIEAVSYGVFYCFLGKVYTKNFVEALRADLISKAKPLQNISSEERGTITRDNISERLVIHEVIHPYLGYVHDPKRMGQYTRFGFRGDDRLLFSQSREIVRVALMGGSFAEGVSISGKNAILKSLRQIDRFKNRRIEFFCLALGGYKQPQQLFTLTYLLSHGIRFDLVINIDGFNEMVLSIVENIPKGVNPLYPRNWYTRAYGFDTETLKLLGKIQFATLDRVGWAERFSNPFLEYSITSNLVWYLYDNHLNWRRIKAEFAYQKYNTANDPESGYHITGPRHEYKSESILYRQLAGVWKQCSRQMAQICKANGMDYFHFLQPNQYVKGSKVIHAAERAVAINPQHPYGPAASGGYPHLNRAGERLTDEGIQFFDLTMVFKSNETPLYSDDCCHLTPEGYDIIGRMMGDAISNYYDHAPVEDS